MSLLLVLLLISFPDLSQLRFLTLRLPPFLYCLEKVRLAVREGWLEPILKQQSWAPCEWREGHKVWMKTVVSEVVVRKAVMIKTLA
jgi:hypothetical protein